jgi:dipeptidyl aminopeptidase/acylaminoacyl peptidase
MKRNLPEVLCASAAVFTAALVLSGACARAGERQLHRFSEVVLAPDASRVAAVESTDPPVDGERARSDLVIRTLDASPPHVVTLPCAPDPECVPSAPVWSPDGRRLVFVLRPPNSTHRMLYAVSSDGSAPRKLVDFEGTLVDPRFAPTGRLAVLATAGAHKEIGATQPGAPIVGVIGESTDEQRIALVGNDGALTYASPQNLFVYEYDWQPGGGFVATAAPGNGDDNWWIAGLYAFDANGEARALYRPSDPEMQIANPRVSPDGTTVAFIGGLMSDFGSTGGDVYALRLDNAAAPANVPNDVTPAFAASATSLSWACPARPQRPGGNPPAPSLEVTALRGSEVERDSVASLGPGSPPSRLQTFGETSASNVTHACAGNTEKLAFVRQSFASPPEIYVGDATGGEPVQLTHENDGLAVEAVARSVRWTSDGATVYGWLLMPAAASGETRRSAAATAMKRPLILEVHGGPAAASTPRFIARGTERELLRAGYDLFLPNPRGSFGNGERFTRANVKDFGYGDLRDDLAGIDAAERLTPVDDARLGITGGSYGGFMSMWTVTQTHRFKAAVALAGISNWISYYGENGIDQWMIPYFGASAYDDPAVYRKSSPIDFIKNVTTPSLVIVGERDVECPAPQSQEFWHALETLGVPTQLVIYAGEGHGLRQPKDRADATRRTLAWFDRYLAVNPS